MGCKAFLRNELKYESEREGHTLKRPSNFFVNSNSCDRCSHLTWITNGFSYIFVLFELNSICEKGSDSENHFEKLETRSTFYQKLYS